MKKEKIKEGFTEVLEKEMSTAMKESMFEYGEYTLKSRAIPRITDGFMTVEGRIIYGMAAEGNTFDKQYRKCARAVGLIIGQYHPHGDTSVYGSFAKLSQPWNTRLPLIEFHGNNGNIIGDGPAAMRYPEARLAKVTTRLIIDDLKNNTVDMVDNYDGTLKEPVELPTKLPLLLINGSEGIAVGFASSFLPHNPYDSVMLMKKYNLNRKMTIEEMIDVIKAPDFPSGGVINGLETVHNAYRGLKKNSCRVRGKVEHSTNKKGHDIIDITCIPPESSHARVMTNIKNLMDSGDLKLRERVQDLTDGNGIRIRLVLKNGEDPTRIEKLLFKKGGLEATSKMISFALIDGAPQNVTLEDMVVEFVKFREKVVYNRSINRLNKCNKDLEIQKGLRITYDNLDKVISMIKSSKNAQEAKASLMKKFKLTDLQASYILDMKLYRLTQLESAIVDKNIKELEKEINVLVKVTSSTSNKHITKIIDEEFDEVLEFLKKEGFDKRLTDIIEVRKEISVMESIKEESRVLVYTKSGRLKNMNIELNSQNRSGTGSTFISQEDDEVELILPTSTTSEVLIFTNFGKVYSLLPYKVEVSSKSSRGLFARAILNLDLKEKIICMLDVPKGYDPKNRSLVFTTESGMIKCTCYEEYMNIRSSGKRAIKLNKNDSLVNVFIYEDKSDKDILVSTYEGFSIRINGDRLTRTGRDSTGVIAIKLKSPKDKVVSSIVLETKTIFFINEKGYIKRVDIDDFNRQSRGGYGVLSGAKVVSVIPDSPKVHHLTVFTKGGMNITFKKENIKKTSRTAVGVKAIKLSANDSVLKIVESDDV